MMEQLIQILKNDINNLIIQGDEKKDSQLINLKRYLKNIEGEFAFEDQDFKDLFQYIVSHNDISDDAKKNIVLSLGLYYWQHNDHSKEEIEVVEENDIELQADEIIRLLRDFGFNDQFINKILSYKNDFSKIRKYSSIDKMKAILDCFRKYNIDASVFDERERQLLKILIHSKSEIIDTIIEYVKEDLINEGLSCTDENIIQRFKAYLGHVSIFGEKKRVYIRRNKKVLQSTESHSDYVGTFLKYKENREFLKRMNIKVKLDSLSVLEMNSELLRDNYILLRKYGFTNLDIENSLSVLIVPDLENRLNLAIELDVFDRFKIHPSHYTKFDRIIASRIKYCQLHNISIDGRGRKDNISLRVSKKSSPFDSSKGGPEEIMPTSTSQVTYNPEKPGNMIKEYRSLLGLVTPTKVKMVDSQVDIDSINDLEYSYTYRKTYLKNILQEFDCMFSFGNLKYIFRKDEKKVIISRLKVQKNIVSLLYQDFQTEISDLTFDNISSILLYCIEKDSLLTEEEDNIIRENVYAFIDSVNKKSEIARDGEDVNYNEYTKRRTRLDSDRG